MSEITLNLLDKLKEAKDSRFPLRQEILLKKSKYKKIFIFEGVDDYPVYDEWMKRNDSYKKSAHLVAKGKKQILSLYKHAVSKNDFEILESCIFFVDHDYDLEFHNNDNIVTLSCYSIENYIVDFNSVQSYIYDEFRMDIRLDDLRQEILANFVNDFDKFCVLTKNLCKPLFVNYNLLEKTKFYEKISTVIDIKYQSINVKKDAIQIGYEVDENSIDAIKLKDIFDTFNYSRAIKGKYVFDFVKIWLNSLKEYLNEHKKDVIFAISKDPLMLDRRRLAGASKLPKEIVPFI